MQNLSSDDDEVGGESMNRRQKLLRMNASSAFSSPSSSSSSSSSYSLPIFSRLYGGRISLSKDPVTALRFMQEKQSKRQVHTTPVNKPQRNEAESCAPFKCLECNLYAPCVAMCYCLSCLLRIKMCTGCGTNETINHHHNRMNRGQFATIPYVCIRCAQSIWFNNQIQFEHSCSPSDSK